MHARIRGGARQSTRRTLRRRWWRDCRTREHQNRATEGRVEVGKRWCGEGGGRRGVLAQASAQAHQAIYKVARGCVSVCVRACVCVCVCGISNNKGKSTKQNQKEKRKSSGEGAHVYTHTEREETHSHTQTQSHVDTRRHVRLRRGRGKGGRSGGPAREAPEEDQEEKREGGERHTTKRRKRGRVRDAGRDTSTMHACFQRHGQRRAATTKTDKQNLVWAARSASRGGPSDGAHARRGGASVRNRLHLPPLLSRALPPAASLHGCSAVQGPPLSLRKGACSEWVCGCLIGVGEMREGPHTHTHTRERSEGIVTRKGATRWSGGKKRRRGERRREGRQG